MNLGFVIGSEIIFPFPLSLEYVLTVKYGQNVRVALSCSDVVSQPSARSHAFLNGKIYFLCRPFIEKQRIGR